MDFETEKQYERMLREHGEEAAELFRKRALEDEVREMKERAWKQRQVEMRRQAPAARASGGCVIVCLATLAAPILGLATLSF